MWNVFNTLAGNLGSSFEHVVFFTLIMLGMIFYAKDFKIGLALQFVVSGCCFMWFYSVDINYVPALVTFLITLVFLSFSIYAASDSRSAGGSFT